MADSARYRYVDWLGGRILENTELNRLQSIIEGVSYPATTPVVFDSDQLYREGATQNVAVTLTGRTVTLAAANGSFPMVVFVRGRWEPFTSGDVESLIFPVGTPPDPVFIYLNYALNIVTYNGAGGTLTDASLVDSTTGQPTAQMGELDFTISLTDTSGTSLDSSTQFEKNTSPIMLWEFQYEGTGTTVGQIILDNVNEPAFGTLGISGLVSLSTATSGGVACASDDSRLTSGVDDGEITDASVRTPISPGGTNADGSSIYNLSSDPGGISAAKIVWVAGTELVSDVIAYLKTSITSILSTLSSHIGVALGSSATHPMPTAADVGAAPLSHVGMQLGLSGSHPPIVTADSGGFQVNETSGVTVGGTSTDAAYALNRASTLLAGIIHNGDIYSSLLQALTMVPGGGPINFSGSPSTLQNVAQVVADHVNQNSHANPHGLSIGDLGGLPVPTTQNNVLGSRALGVVYVASSGALQVQVGMSETSDASTGLYWWMTAQCGADSGSMITVGHNGVSNASDGYCGVTFIVPSGYSYEITYTSSNGSHPSPPPTLTYWVEVPL